MSGLSAAIRLSHFGFKTLLLERHYRPGGLNSFYKMGGYDLDVGLHAMTNYITSGPKQAPLNMVVRQLRLSLPDMKLAPQNYSKIVFPDKTITFDNDFNNLAQYVAEGFPGQADNFIKLADMVRDYNIMDYAREYVSGRKVVSSIISDPLLVEMLFLPLMYYGSAEEDDMEFGQFVVMFRSIFLEGFARPEGGVRRLIKQLVRRIKDGNGKIRLKTGVAKVVVEKGAVRGVVLDNGEQIECGFVISSVGLPETADLCSQTVTADSKAGNLSFMESINILENPPSDIGEGASIVFFSRNEKFRYRNPDEHVDLDSGVICYPDNFGYEEPAASGMIRITHMADHRFWLSADEKTYAENKKLWHERSIGAVKDIAPDLGGEMAFTDVFTPKTIRDFTGHINGTVYGAPDKLKTGRTDTGGLYVCGTDQGFLGIVGSMISGVMVANDVMKSIVR